MNDLHIQKCEQCGSPIKLGEVCRGCGSRPGKPAKKNRPSGSGHRVGSTEPSGDFPKYFPGRKSTRPQLGQTLIHRQRLHRAQRVGLIMVLLAVAIIFVKHRVATVDVDLVVLFKKIPMMFKLRASGTELGVLSYATIALGIDAAVLFILYLYSFTRPVPGLMLLVVASIVDCILLFDPVLLIRPGAILVILAIKILVMLILLSGYKSAKMI